MLLAHHNGMRMTKVKNRAKFRAENHITKHKTVIDLSF
jgi:hypothetical protein